MDDDAAFITRLKGFGLNEKEAVVYFPPQIWPKDSFSSSEIAKDLS
jgi:hypothetical protein